MSMIYSVLYLCMNLCFLLSSARYVFIFFFFSSRRRHTRSDRDWSSDVCSSDLRLRRRAREVEERGSDPGAHAHLGGRREGRVPHRSARTADGAAGPGAGGTDADRKSVV